MNESWRSRIAIEPSKRSGQPCIRGLRITVRDVLSYLAGGMSIAEFLEDFPYLNEDDVRACFAYAAAEHQRQSGPPAIALPTLTGRWVRLEPLAEAHRAGLRTAADDSRIWTHMTVDATGAGFDPWFDAALARQATAVRRLADGALVGSTSYLDHHPAHKRVEIGATWYRPDCWATAVNPECKLLLMAHAFETLRLNRVAYVTDLLNEQSQAAIAKLGATREGVCRAHMVTQGGRVRDSVLFSIISSEWPAVKERLLARLAAFECG